MHRYNVNTLSYFVMVPMIMITWYYMPICHRCHRSLSLSLCFVRYVGTVQIEQMSLFSVWVWVSLVYLFLSSVWRFCISFWLHYMHFNFISRCRIVETVLPIYKMTKQKDEEEKKSYSHNNTNSNRQTMYLCSLASHSRLFQNVC